jgi:hypothetical protein
MIPLSITVANLDEAAVAIHAIEAFRAGNADSLPGSPKTAKSSDLADRIYAALTTPTFTKPSQVVVRVLLASAPSERVPLSSITAAFIAEGLATTQDQAWNRARAAFATLSWLMDQHLGAQDKAGAAKPIDVLAARSTDENGIRLYTLTQAGREAAQRFFGPLG